jgi:hypothetical protein
MLIFQYASFITFHIIKEFVNMQTSHNSTKLVFILCHEFLIFLGKMYSEEIYIINKDLQSFFFKSLKKHPYQDLFNQIKRSNFSYLNFYLHNVGFLITFEYIHFEYCENYLLFYFALRLVFISSLF